MSWLLTDADRPSLTLSTTAPLSGIILSKNCLTATPSLPPYSLPLPSSSPYPTHFFIPYSTVLPYPHPPPPPLTPPRQSPTLPTPTAITTTRPLRPLRPLAPRLPPSLPFPTQRLTALSVSPKRPGSLAHFASVWEPLYLMFPFLHFIKSFKQIRCFLVTVLCARSKSA